MIRDTANGAVAFGTLAGLTSQGNAAVAIGQSAGYTGQGVNTVAVGRQAGASTQGSYAVAIGSAAAYTSQGNNSVAIGADAGQTAQGQEAVAIGYGAGTNSQANNSIILNATGSALNQTRANTFTVAPVRNDVANVAQVMFYNTTSKEVTYGNVISVAGNINASQFNFANGVNILSTVAGTYSNANVTSYLPTYSGNVRALNFVGAIQAQVGSSFSYATDVFGSLYDTGQVFLTADTNSNAIVAGYTIVGNSGAVTLTVTSATFVAGSPNFVQVATTPTASSLAYPVTVYSADYVAALPNSSLTVGNAAVASNVSIGGNLTVSGNIVQQSAYYETYSNVTNSGGNLTCNFVNGATFYATLTANVTVNFTNVVATAGRVTGATLIVDQGATAYRVANIQINSGGIQTVKYAGGTPNTGTASNTDVMSFSLISLDGTNWRVLGQISNYG